MRKTIQTISVVAFFAAALAYATFSGSVRAGGSAPERIAERNAEQVSTEVEACIPDGELGCEE